jgi:DNA polymerase-3 subunit delta
VRAGASNLSLFASRRLVELRLPTGRPGVAGSAAIVELIERRDADTLFMIITGRLERESQGAAWVRAAEEHGVWMNAWPVGREKLPAWLDGRTRRAGLNLDRAALELLAERTEGNLLAAQQEIDRLSLALAGAVGVAELTASVADNARFDVFKLAEAARRGDAARSLRIVEGLRAEGVEATLVLWALLRELRQTPRDGGRHARRDFPRLAERAARADRAIKGRLQANAWDEMALFAADLCGVRLPLVRRA